MKHSDFKVGENFWCGGHQWRCTDIGTRVVVAIRIDQVESMAIDSAGGEVRRVLTIAEAEQEGWFTGPPYGVVEIVFDEYDQPACSLDGESNDSSLPPNALVLAVGLPEFLRKIRERRRSRADIVVTRMAAYATRFEVGRQVLHNLKEVFVSLETPREPKFPVLP